MTGAVTLGAVAVTTAAPAAAYADTTATSPCGTLPTGVEGRPANLHVLGKTGDYLWHDDKGWHLRVTHPSRSRVVFRGVVVASSPMTFQRVRDEAHDKVAISSDGLTMAFRFVNHGGIDGVDFADDCASTVKVALSINGHRLVRSHIYVGKAATHPAHNPFVISRADPTPAA
jgi:hypothetical protein